MIFNLIKHAKQLLFDDSKAKTGSSNVQGAIESMSEEMIYCGEGDSYMGVDSNGNIKKITIAENESKEITLSTKEAVQSHDKVLEVLKVTDISDVITLHNNTELYYAKYCNGKVDIMGVTNKELTITAFIDLLTIGEKYRPSESINGCGIAVNSANTPWLVLASTGKLVAAAKNGTIPANGNVRFNISYYLF